MILLYIKIHKDNNYLTLFILKRKHEPLAKRFCNYSKLGSFAGVFILTTSQSHP